MQANEDPKKGAGLEYGYIDVRDEYRDGKSILNFFIKSTFYHSTYISHDLLIVLMKTTNIIENLLTKLILSKSRDWSIKS